MQVMADPMASTEVANTDEAIRLDNTSSEFLNGSHIPPEVSSIPLTQCPLSDSIFKELSAINGQINNLKKKDLVKKLKEFHLNHKGDTYVLQKRLKNHFRDVKLIKANLMEKQILQPYYVIIDFEATCQENNPVDYKYEIIEFPAILVHTETLRIIDVFHSYVKPVLHGQLTTFCIKLTGISQNNVDNAPKFPKVLRKFELWLSSHGLLSSQKFIVTDGPWDMGRFLYLQCKLSKVPYPAYAREWINVRRIFRNFYHYHQGGTLEDMVKFAGLKFEGRAHSGLDDSYNIARMFIHLLKDGALIRTNEKITLHCRSHNNMNAIPINHKKSTSITHEEVLTLRDELSNLSISLGEATEDFPSSEMTNENQDCVSSALNLSASGKTSEVYFSDDHSISDTKHIESSENKSNSHKALPNNTFSENMEVHERILEILQIESKPRRSKKSKQSERGLKKMDASCVDDPNESTSSELLDSTNCSKKVHTL